jgi:hypothetical protein
MEGAMYRHPRPRHYRRWAAALMVVIVITAVALGAEAQQQKAPADHQKEAPSEIVDPGVSPLDIKEKKIDRAGKNRSGDRGLERFRVAALGRWVTTEVFYGIRWFKLLLCLAAVFGILLVERILRFPSIAKLRPFRSRRGSSPGCGC